MGVHSDEEIAENKGPTVMTLPERLAAVDACKWTTKTIPDAPYVTALDWISHYGCQYVVHGDDITSDASGEDCYRFVKAAGRFIVVKRTPGISTTDLVGRMLLCTKSHHIKSLQDYLSHSSSSGGEGGGPAALQRIQDYATDATGKQPGSEVWMWKTSSKTQLLLPSSDAGSFENLVAGRPPRPGQSVIYVDGGFDLFSSGHIEFLKRVTEAEHQQAYVVAGIHDDGVINHWKDLNYPIMNIFERGLCVLQCKYVHAVVFGAPFAPSKAYLQTLPYGQPAAVYHGPTAFMPLDYDPYVDAQALGILRRVPDHPFKHVNAGEIVQRIMTGRAAFEERQRRKKLKAVGEEAQRLQEMENEAASQQ